MDIRTKALKIQAIEPETTKSQRSENIQLNPLLETLMSDSPEWTFAQLLGKKRHVVTINVSSDTTGPIFEYDNSPDALLITFPSPVLYDYFLYIRYNLVFEIEVQSHFQHQGSLILNQINYRPNEVFGRLGLQPSLFTQASNIFRTLFPHDFITFGHNGNYRIVMPWICNRNMLPITNQSTATGLRLRSYSLGYFQISVFDQLQAVAGAVGTSSVRIWAHCENIDYSGYLPNY